MEEVKYVAKCHCESVCFSFNSIEIKKGMRCDCSICVRKAITMSDFYVPAENLDYDFSKNQLARYLWNDRVMNHYFCKTCGITPFIGAEDYGYRINLGCVEGLNPLALTIRINDGKSMPVTKSGEG